MFSFDLDFDGDFDAFDAVTGYFLANDGLDEGKKSELVVAGLDSYELGLMDAGERRKALEDAGLDPDDFSEFDF